MTERAVDELVELIGCIIDERLAEASGCDSLLESKCKYEAIDNFKKHVVSGFVEEYQSDEHRR